VVFLSLVGLFFMILKGFIFKYLSFDLLAKKILINNFEKNNEIIKGFFKGQKHNYTMIQSIIVWTSTWML